MNSQVSMQALLKKHFGVDVAPGAGCRCPFHDDSRRSAKLFADNVLYCWAESRQYRPFDVLLLLGSTLQQLEDQYGKLVGVVEIESPQTLVTEEFTEMVRQARWSQPSLEEALVLWRGYQNRLEAQRK